MYRDSKILICSTYWGYDVQFLWNLPDFWNLVWVFMLIGQSTTSCPSSHVAAARNVLYSILSISKLIKLQRMSITSSFPNLYSVEIAISKSRIFLLALLLNFFHNLNMLVGCKKIEWQGMTDVFSQRKLLRMHPINVNQNSKLNQCKMVQSNDL